MRSAVWTASATSLFLAGPLNLLRGGRREPGEDRQRVPNLRAELVLGDEAEDLALDLDVVPEIAPAHAVNYRVERADLAAQQLILLAERPDLLRQPGHLLPESVNELAIAEPVLLLLLKLQPLGLKQEVDEGLETAGDNQQDSTEKPGADPFPKGLQAARVQSSGSL